MRRATIELEAADYQVVRNPRSFGFAAGLAIRVRADGLDGGADPGHDGIVLAV
jgi:gamma-glutamyltranspeptidase/glutathione hydrolase